MSEDIKKEKEEQVRKLRSVSNFLKWEDWKLIIDILKNARTSYVRGILATTETQDKIYTQDDINKTEIKAINRILNLSNIITGKLEDEEHELNKLLESEEEPEIEIGDENEIFNTVDA